MRKYTDEQLVEAVKISKSYREVCRNLFGNNTNNRTKVSEEIKKLNLDTSHFVNSSYHGKTRYANLVGQKRGMLEVIEVMSPDPKNTNTQRSYRVRCSCSCGGFIIMTPSYFIKGKTYSCGCTLKLAFAKYSGKNSPRYKGKDELSGIYWSRILRRCTICGIEYKLDIDYALDLFYKQNKKCALSGIDIFFAKKGQTASLDRIDSSKGYIEGNVQWVHKDINRMKQEFTEEYFIDLCTKISKFRTK